MADIRMASLHEVSKKIASGEITSTELVKAVIDRTAALEPEINAYITFLGKEALDAAAKADEEIRLNGPKSPLHGIPVALKDLFYTKGIPTTAGSGLMKDFRPDHDATVVKRLRDAGAIIMGKTNTHEWAFGPTTEDSYFGASHNPWNTAYITGGSSGGSAAAVAAGMCYMAMGSDTGGSVRIPAACCGTVGFKPSFGLVSLYGVIPLSFNLDHPGPLARSTMDAAITIDAISGYDPLDPCPGKQKRPHTEFAKAIENIESLNGLVLGIPKNFFFDKVERMVGENFANSVRILEKCGAKIVEVEINCLDRVPDVSTVIMSAEAAWWHKERLAKNPDGYQPPVKARLKTGEAYLATEYIAACQERNDIINAWDNALEGIDAVIVPTLPITAYPIGTGMGKIKVNGRDEAARDMLTRHTRLANTTGGPALTVPNGMVNGLPTGLMIMGKNNDDEKVLSIGYAYEKAAKFNFIQY